MPTWISSLVLAGLLLLALPAGAEVITRLPTDEKVVALTFDACESKTPAFLDHSISEFLVARKIPFTIFLAGRFVSHNRADLEALSRLDFVELENHSMDHFNHMDRLNEAAVESQVKDAETVIAAATGRRTRLFRFPAGNYDASSLAAVEGLGYKVVHWSFESGDPARSLTPTHLTDWVLAKTKPGSILIFHINGRGYATGAALPGIVAGLEARGYRFVTLDRYIR